MKVKDFLKDNNITDSLDNMLGVEKKLELTPQGDVYLEDSIETLIELAEADIPEDMFIAHSNEEIVTAIKTVALSIKETIENTNKANDYMIRDYHNRKSRELSLENENRILKKTIKDNDEFITHLNMVIRKLKMNINTLEERIEKYKNEKEDNTNYYDKTLSKSLYSLNKYFEAFMK